MNVPEQSYAFIFAKGETPQFNYQYDSVNGTPRLVYEGVASSKVTVNDAAWVVQKTTYTGSNFNPDHQSILTGVIWALVTTYTFP